MCHKGAVELKILRSSWDADVAGGTGSGKRGEPANKPSECQTPAFKAPVPRVGGLCTEPDRTVSRQQLHGTTEASCPVIINLHQEGPKHWN